MKHNLRINIVPYRLTSDGIDLYFLSQAGAGQKIIRTWVPSDLNVPKDDNGYCWWSLDEVANSTKVRFEFFKKDVDEENRRHFVKRVFTQLLYKHFQSSGFIVGTSYVGDVRVWKEASIQPTNRKCQLFDKFSLRIDSNMLGVGSGVFLSYDGQSSVSVLPVNQLNIPDRGIIGKVIHNNRVYSRTQDDFPVNLDDCRVVFNRGIERALDITLERRRPQNKYREYYDKIVGFYEQHLRGKSIAESFEVLSSGFLAVPESAISSVDDESNFLEFKDRVRNVNVYDGLKRAGGPYAAPELSHLRFLFVYMESDREAANKLFSYLNKGYKNFPGLEKYVAVPFQVDLTKSLKVKSEDTIVAEVSDWLSRTNFEADKKYFVLYVSPINKNEEDVARHAIYFKIKEQLLEKEISSQVVFKDHMSEDAFNFYLPNIAVAILAKLGGIPWRLPYPLKKDLVVGIGVHRDSRTSSSFIGNAICFHNDGQFEEFRVFPSDDIGQLVQSLKKSIQEFVTKSGACERLVIHYYKDVGRMEREMIDSAMKQLDITIPYVFVTVKDTESKDYVIFDESFEGRIPTSGTMVRLRFNEFLLCNNTRYQSNTGQKLLGYPFPVKIKVKSEPRDLANDFTVVKELLDQVYEFSRIYWKSIRQRSKPVTIEYSEIIAGVVSEFTNKKLPASQTATKSLWFL